MKKRVLFTWTIAALGLLLTLASKPAAADDDDPPSRVARMNYAQGSVSFQPGGEGDWLTAVPNRPLTSGDNLWTDRDSRAELHVGSTALRMGSETSLTFLNLNDRALQLRLAQGSLILRVRHVDDEDTFEVDAPNLALSLVRTGEYRIDVNSEGDQTRVTVWHGQGRVTGGGYSYTVVAGQQAVFHGADPLQYDIEQIPGPDGFDNWAFGRDRHEDRAEASNYISPEVTGYEDLDDYGRWRYVAGYGNVWIPAGVPEGWAPYRYGHWVWVHPWGWTWVEDEPWGFAPFHYGRWAYVPGGWCWVPGPVVVRPVYAPALVAFVGGGSGFHFSLAIGGGGVGWFPLAPGEVYVPPYRVSPTYVNNVNVTNTTVNVTKVTNVYNTYITNNNTNINHITYVNQRVNNAVTVVSHDTFVNARPVSRNVVQLSPKEVAEAPVTHAAPVQPARNSVLGAGTATRIKPPLGVMNRPVLAVKTPAPPRPSFAERQAVPSHVSENPAPPEKVAQPERTVARPPESTRPQIVNTQGRPGRADERLSAPSPTETRNVARPPESNGSAGRQEQSWSHPLAKPAPPVQEKNERQSQEEEQKYRSWQQQREKSVPAANQPPHAEKPQRQPGLR